MTMVRVAWWRRMRGQALVEFTLVVYLLIFLLIAVIEFAHLLFMYTATTSAAAEAARYAVATGQSANGVPYYQDCQGIEDAALRIAALAGLQRDNIRITYDHGPGTAVFAECPNPPTQISGGDRVIVEVRVYYEPWVPLFPDLPLGIRGQSSRTLVGQIQVSPPGP